MFVYRSSSLSFTVYRTLCLSIYLSFYLSICLLVCLIVCHLPPTCLYLCLSPFAYLSSFFLTLYCYLLSSLSLCLSLNLSLSLYLFLSFSLCVITLGPTTYPPDDQLSTCLESLTSTETKGYHLVMEISITFSVGFFSYLIS